MRRVLHWLIRRAQTPPSSLNVLLCAVGYNFRHAHTQRLKHFQEGRELRVAADGDRSVEIGPVKACVLRQAEHSATRFRYATDSDEEGVLATRFIDFLKRDRQIFEGERFVAEHRAE